MVNASRASPLAPVPPRKALVWRTRPLPCRASRRPRIIQAITALRTWGGLRRIPSARSHSEASADLADIGLQQWLFDVAATCWLES